MLGFEGENAREKVIVLLTMCFALAMAMLDNTVVNVAIPRIQTELGASVSAIQWIIDGYVLAFASLLLTGGIAGDRYGRKKMFLMGLAIFTAASFLCGISSSPGQLIAFRALQGVGAAFLMPGTLSILTVTFPPQERAKAIGLWAGVSGIALALGPTLGGYMVEHIGWESVFFLNVPIGIVAFFVAMRTVTESRLRRGARARHPRADPGDARPPVPHLRPDRGEPEGVVRPGDRRLAHRLRRAPRRVLLVGAPQPEGDDAAARSSGSPRSRPGTRWRSRSRSGCSRSSCS